MAANVDTLNKQGLAQAKQKQFQDAIQSFSQAIQLEPRAWISYYNRGNLYAALKQYPQALADFAKVIQLNPSHAQAYLNLGILLLNQNQTGKARQCFKNAHRLGHPKAEAYLQRLQQDSAPAKAAPPPKPQPQLTPPPETPASAPDPPAEKPPETPKDANSHLTHGLSRIALGQYEEAIDAFNEAVQLDPAIIKTYIEQGLPYKVEFTQAMGKLQKAEPMVPGAAALADKLKQMMSGPLKEPEPTPPPPSAAPPEETGSAEEYNTEGLADLEQGNFEVALAKFNRAIDLDPTMAMAYSNRSAAYEGLQRFEEAIADESKALELDPTLAHSHYNRSVLYYQTQRFADALDDLKRAVELDPNFTMAYFNMGVIYLEVNNTQKALESFERSAALGYDQAAQYAAELREALRNG